MTFKKSSPQGTPIVVDERKTGLLIVSVVIVTAVLSFVAGVMADKLYTTSKLKFAESMQHYHQRNF